MKTKKKREKKEDSFDDKKMIHFSVAFTLHEKNTKRGDGRAGEN